MTSLSLETLMILILIPAISICDEDLGKMSPSDSKEQMSEILNDIESDSPHGLKVEDYTNDIGNTWKFTRQLRAPSGFYGMRGKKSDDITNYWQPDSDDFGDENDENLSTQIKRANSQAFFGVRGKKYFDFKRGPSSGFMGVRGKKDDASENEIDDLQAEMFQKLQEEREKIANLVRNYIEEEQKRNVEFRDKKSVNNDDFFDNEKRSPMGFQGVRGKKSEFANFIGSDEKRVPVSGFFGMRGKKQPLGYPSSSFFGVRKKPFLPYGKFVGVRGKKDDKFLRIDPLELNNGNGLKSAQRVGPDSTQEKRLGFIGMRG